MKQTAAQFLYEFVQLKLTYEQQTQFEGLFHQALDMEKEQIKNAFLECWKANVPNGIECKLDAEQYYNETYKSK